MTSKEKVLAVCKILSSKKAENIVYIDVSEKSSLCDYFVIAGARSSTAVRALCDNLEEKMEKDFGKKAVGEILKDLIVKPKGAPTLAPESDKRPEYQFEEQVLAAFDEGA